MSDEEAERWWWSRFPQRVRDEAAIPYCSADDVDVALEWQMDDHGGLRGRVLITNTGTRACRVGGKPGLSPLGMNGDALPAQHIVSTELRMPSWALLAPGQQAAAGVSWSGWCGDPASGRVRVRWQDGEATVTVNGPPQPRCPYGGQPTNLSSTWFTPVESDSPGRG